MNILYVSAQNPYPAVYGGQIDLWNRLRVLGELEHTTHLVQTVKEPLTPEAKQAILKRVDRLTEVPRTSLVRGLFSRMPVQMAVRKALRHIDLGREPYDLILLDEFTGEVLHNPSLSAARIAIRNHNDESSYQRKLAEATPDRLHRLYFHMEAARMERYVPELWKRADALWFVSPDELAAFERRNAAGDLPGLRELDARFLPPALDLRAAGKPPLGTRRVLFLGSLAVSLNQDAVRWYLEHVHPLLLDEPGYQLVVAGSTLGQDLGSFRDHVQSHPAVELQCDVPDLEPLFRQCSVFINPMRHGTGVKLKTVEAALRGLPLVSTTVGAEGSGLQDGVHCHITDDAQLFAAAVRTLLRSPEEACQMRERAAEYILTHYNQAEQLRAALNSLNLPS